MSPAEEAGACRVMKTASSEYMESRKKTKNMPKCSRTYRRTCCSINCTASPRGRADVADVFTLLRRVCGTSWKGQCAYDSPQPCPSPLPAFNCIEFNLYTEYPMSGCPLLPPARSHRRILQGEVVLLQPRSLERRPESI